MVYPQVEKLHLKLSFVALTSKLWGEVEFQVPQNLGIYGARRVETYAGNTCVYTVALVTRGQWRYSVNYRQMTNIFVIY
jgi:hypothetical protein